MQRPSCHGCGPRVTLSRDMLPWLRTTCYTVTWYLMDYFKAPTSLETVIEAAASWLWANKRSVRDRYCSCSKEKFSVVLLSCMKLSKLLLWYLNCALYTPRNRPDIRLLTLCITYYTLYYTLYTTYLASNPVYCITITYYTLYITYLASNPVYCITYYTLLHT